MDAFAENYDIMVGADYDKICKFIHESIKKYKSDSSLVCDLGCGTGTVAITLSEMGYDMIAIDTSEEMLMKAREKAAFKQDKGILFLCQNIVDFELYGTVDVIYSTLDTLNYITSKRDLNTLFKWVRNYLNYDGLFIFDVNSKHKFDDLLKYKTYIYDFDDVFCTWETEYLSDKLKYNHYLTYFRQCDNGLYERYDNIQTQRYYSCEEIETIATKYDFQVLAKKDDYTEKSVSYKTERITYILKINKTKK